MIWSCNFLAVKKKIFRDTIYGFGHELDTFPLLPRLIQVFYFMYCDSRLLCTIQILYLLTWVSYWAEAYRQHETLQHLSLTQRSLTLQPAVLRLHHRYRCGFFAHVAHSTVFVSVCWVYSSAGQKRTNWSRCCLGADYVRQRTLYQTGSRSPQRKGHFWGRRCAGPQ